MPPLVGAEEGKDAPFVLLRHGGAAQNGKLLGPRLGDVLPFPLLFGARHVGNDLPVFEFDDAVCIRLGEFPVVRDDDDELFFGKLFERIKHLRARCRVKRARRLIRHDDLGLLDERPRDGDALLLPARERVGLAVGIPLHVDHGQQLVDARLVAGFSLQFERKGDVLPHRQFVEDVVLLEDEADVGIAVGIEVAPRKVLGRLAFDDDLALVGRVQPARHVEEGALPAPRSPEQKHHARFGEIERHMIERVDFLPLGRIRFGQVSYLQHIVIGCVRWYRKATRRKI